MPWLPAGVTVQHRTCQSLTSEGREMSFPCESCSMGCGQKTPRRTRSLSPLGFVELSVESTHNAVPLLLPQGSKKLQSVSPSPPETCLPNSLHSQKELREKCDCRTLCQLEEPLVLPFMEGVSQDAWVPSPAWQETQMPAGRAPGSLPAAQASG